jgi:two-component system response regulator NreC
MAISVFIVDDHSIFRTGLQTLLSEETDLKIVGEAADGKEAVLKAEQLNPEIIVMDINLPGMNGLETTKEILARLPGAKVLFLTVHEDSKMLREALDIGGVGYILKRAVESELINAIRAVARGDMYIYPSMTRAFLKEASTPSPPTGHTEPITTRESEVLTLIARGYTNRQIGEKLCISVRTVESHRANIMDKLNLTSRVELVRYARAHGLLD